MVETRSCPICGHGHLDYLFPNEEGTDEACVSCGCDPSIYDLLGAAVAARLAELRERVEGLPETGEYVGLHGLRSQVDRADILALLAPQADKAHQPGDHHEYTMTCKVCGVPGLIRVSIDPERAPQADKEPQP